MVIRRNEEAIFISLSLGPVTSHLVLWNILANGSHRPLETGPLSQVSPPLVVQRIPEC
jgi:hypothetical protein